MRARILLSFTLSVLGVVLLLASPAVGGENLDAEPGVVASASVAATTTAATPNANIDSRLDYLIQSLSDPNLQVRREAALALGELGPAAAPAAPALVEALDGDMWFVVPAVVEALGQIGAPAVPALIEGLKSDTARIRSEAAIVLGRLGAAIIAEADEADEAIEALIAALQDPDATVRQRAAQALAAVDSSAVDRLIAALASGDAAGRRAAAAALDVMRAEPVEALEVLESALVDADDTVRLSVARTLERIGTSEAAYALRAVAEDALTEVRLIAVRNIERSQVDREEVVRLLAGRLADSDRNVKREAARALGRLGPEARSAADDLLAALKEPDPFTQNLIAQALHQMGVVYPATVDMYTPQGTQVPVQIHLGSTAASQFVALGPFDALEVNTPTWRGTGGKLRFSLFAWDTDYATTVAGTPIVSQTFVDITDNAWLRMEFATQEPGEYLWLLDQPESTVSVWKWEPGIAGIRAYEDGTPMPGSYAARISYTERPPTPVGALSDFLDFLKPVTPPPPHVDPADHPVHTLDVRPDTWVATDGLGRTLPSHEEVGDVRPEKQVGLFYWTWHYNFAEYTKPYNNSEIMAQYPEAIHDLDHPAWGPIGAAHFWNEPLFGYYDSRDPWVLRRHAEMLADAGVDAIFFDATNGSYTWRPSYTELFRVFSEARKQGVNTPQVAFMLAFWPSEGSMAALKQLYLDIYRDGKYQELWFYWDGKPLIMAYPDRLNRNDPLEREILEFFTFRPGQPLYTRGPTRPDHWGWLSVYPQHKFGVRPDGTAEQMTVGIAQNHSAARGLTAMNAGPDVFGRSHTVQHGRDPRPDSVLYGANFAEQWEYALEVDPDFIFITGWNEWIAGRHETWQGITNAFPDQFDDEHSRDIEPTKGDLKDHYYYQMVSYIRRFKGVRPPEPASAPKNIDLSNADRSEDQWSDVGPTYRHYPGSTLHRDHSGWVGTHYTNTTGRNDIVLAKVARDSEYIYFMVETAAELSPKEDPGWMRLFIDTTPEDTRAWEGYEFVVNRVNPGEKAVVEASQGGWNWVEVGRVDYAINGNRLEIAIPRAMLGLEEDPIDFNFKWSDNMQNEGDILDFYQYGDTAPGGRFKYRYFTDPN